MFPKEAETVSVPTISYDNKHRMLQDEDMDSFRRERGDSFKDMMKNSIPSVARIPSPKPHRKHHHHHHHHKSKSPGMPRKENSHHSASAVQESPYLTVDSGDMFRARSYSDSSISQKKKVEKTSSVSPQFRRAVYTRHKNSVDEDDGDESDGGIRIEIDNKEEVADTTISRDVIGSNSVSQTSDGETITRRKEELVNQVQAQNNKLCKKRTLKMIDQLLEQCSDNYRVVETDIEFEFTRLHVALENRKKELIEEAKNNRDKKVEGLKKSKKKCLKSTSVLAVSSTSSLNGSDNDSESGTANSSRRSSGEQDECLQLNGILEPWKSSPSENVDNVDAALDRVAKKLSGAGQVFSDQLDEGNMSFKFNEESLEMFANVGKVDCDLSSAQFSFAKGLQHGIALAGETVRFEVHTRNIREEVSFSSKDSIKCQIFDFNGENIEATNQVSLHRSLSNGRVVTPSSPHSALHKFYSYVFTPQDPGKYEVRVYINDVEIKSSPFVVSVYPKVDLTFDVKTPEERVDMSGVGAPPTGVCKNTLEERRKSMKRRQSSEESDWADVNWIVQKGDKSTLLRSVKDIPSYIYASPSVKGFCAWKLRVTSACESIVLSIGVGTHSGIPDIDEHFSCDFAACPNKKANSVGTRMQVRRTSSFTRISMTYDVLLSTEEGLVRVMCEQNDEDKTVQINTKVTEQFELFPFVSMVHRHEACARQVCPRPQITLL